MLNCISEKKASIYTALSVNFRGFDKFVLLSRGVDKFCKLFKLAGKHAVAPSALHLNHSESCFGRRGTALAKKMQQQSNHLNLILVAILGAKITIEIKIN